MVDFPSLLQPGQGVKKARKEGEISEEQ